MHSQAHCSVLSGCSAQGCPVIWSEMLLSQSFGVGDKQVWHPSLEQRGSNWTRDGNLKGRRLSWLRVLGECQLRRPAFGAGTLWKSHAGKHGNASLNCNCVNSKPSVKFSSGRLKAELCLYLESLCGQAEWPGKPIWSLPPGLLWSHTASTSPGSRVAGGIRNFSQDRGVDSL